MRTGQKTQLRIIALALAAFTFIGLLLIVIGAALDNVPLIIVGVVIFGIAILVDLLFLLQYANEIREGMLIGRGSREYKLRGKYEVDSPVSTSRLRASPQDSRNSAVLQNIKARDQTNQSSSGPGQTGMSFPRYDSTLHRLPPVDMENDMNMLGDIQHAMANYESQSAIQSPLPEIVEMVHAPLQPLDSTQLVTLASLGPTADAQIGDLTPINQSSPMRSLEQSRSSSPSTAGHRYSQGVLENKSTVISREISKGPNKQLVSHPQSTSAVNTTTKSGSARSSMAIDTTLARRIFDDGGAKLVAAEHVAHHKADVFEETAA